MEIVFAEHSSLLQQLICTLHSFTTLAHLAPILGSLATQK